MHACKYTRRTPFLCPHRHRLPHQGDQHAEVAAGRWYHGAVQAGHHFPQPLPFVQVCAGASVGFHYNIREREIERRWVGHMCVCDSHAGKGADPCAERRRDYCVHAYAGTSTYETRVTRSYRSHLYRVHTISSSQIRPAHVRGVAYVSHIFMRPLHCILCISHLHAQIQTQRVFHVLRARWRAVHARIRQPPSPPTSAWNSGERQEELWECRWW